MHFSSSQLLGAKAADAKVCRGSEREDRAVCDGAAVSTSMVMERT
jgi:hypothetical protein